MGLSSLVPKSENYILLYYSKPAQSVKKTRKAAGHCPVGLQYILDI
ncbi:hypothetical protein HMPREF0372_03041 [Flavonifractor plautii ATCC 29863]|uniref:Uncharacterized protein n=1 Tax=Flavonifractor plautii ATCC 29863 TaxID=411475 RepID=G9YU28_FLAPL|nr:hypothetical protein HMPREF0372_03041 [Flavonifractor plautii ATCC 29863]